MTDRLRRALRESRDSIERERRANLEFCPTAARQFDRLARAQIQQLDFVEAEMDRGTPPSFILTALAVNTARAAAAVISAMRAGGNARRAAAAQFCCTLLAAIAAGFLPRPRGAGSPVRADARPGPAMEGARANGRSPEVGARVHPDEKAAAGPVLCSRRPGEAGR